MCAEIYFNSEEKTVKNYLKVLLCFSAVVTLTLSPFLDLARGTPAALLRVNRGIHAVFLPPTDCTLYAAASGGDTQPGTLSQPISFFGATQTATAGAVVCLLGGRYELPCTAYIKNSGTPSNWITFKSYGDGDALIVWKGGYTCGDYPMIKIDSTRTGGSPTNYLQFIGLVLDGQGTALDGFFCNSNHDLRFSNNVISNTGGAGIATVGCNYVVSDHNIINHNGYVQTGAPSGYSWTSGISYNNNACNDTYTGAHFVASNNIIVGEVDQSPMIVPPPRTSPTDSNGIIVDINQTCVTPNVPPASIVVNNVIYGNGGRCIEANQVANSWVVNNTCYINDLDTLQTGIGSITSNNSSNPQFVGFVPYFDPAATNQYQTSRPPSVVTPNDNGSPRCIGWVPTCDIFSSFVLASTSPAYNQGIDPSTLTTDPNMKSDLQTWNKDINGKPRTVGSNWDLGAIAH